MPESVSVNRAPVLTLWAAIVAERLGYDRAEALTIGRAISGLAAQSKGRRLGIYEEPTEKEKRERRQTRAEHDRVTVMGWPVPVQQTEHGLRAVYDDRPLHPAAVEHYLRNKFGPALPEVEQALRELAESYPKEELPRQAYRLYEEFRPHIPSGERGWGRKGELSLEVVRSLVKPKERRKAA